MMEYNSTILIVDDQLSAREVLRGVLTEQGYKLELACNGQEALCKARELTPDLILLDVMMPGITGIEVCQRMRADPLLAEVPIIMVTALDDNDSLLQGISAGADDLITKPFNYAELKARVRTITRLARYRRLLMSRTRLEWVIEQAQDGYIFLDHTDKICYMNRQARLYLNLLGDKSTLPTETFSNLIQGQFNLEPEQAWVTWPADSQTERYLVRPESAASQAFYLKVSAKAFSAGLQGDWIVQLQDVTAIMTAERAVWQFQSLIAHKLRTPLGSIITGLHLLKEEEAIKQLNSEAEELFDIIFQGGQRLEKDIEDILRFITTPVLAQPEAGFHLSRLQTILSQLSTELELEPLTIVENVAVKDANIPLSEQAIELVLREILKNAKKFHPKKVPKVEISIHVPEEGRQICLEISDNGLTLSPDQLARIWMPYFQGEKYFTGQSTGMGLGLSSVAFLMWSIGGTYGAYNRKDKPGLTVELGIPIIMRQEDE